MVKVGPWVDGEGCAYRALLGTDGSKAENRVAMIEKTPRVRIRPAYIAHIGNDNRHWPEFLDWCERGWSGIGPSDLISRKWCDDMLRVMELYEITE